MQNSLAQRAFSVTFLRNVLQYHRSVAKTERWNCEGGWVLESDIKTKT